jgi:hypothetical protein
MKFRCASSATRELSIGKVQCGLQSTKIVSFLVACQADIEGGRRKTLKLRNDSPRNPLLRTKGERTVKEYRISTPHRRFTKAVPLRSIRTKPSVIPEVFEGQKKFDIF